jgi:hypothetical protein
LKVRLAGKIIFVHDLEAENIKDAKNKFYRLLTQSFLDHSWYIDYDDKIIEERTEELNQKPKYEDDNLLL